jgi:hypothetical protein
MGEGALDESVFSKTPLRLPCGGVYRGLARALADDLARVAIMISWLALFAGVAAVGLAALCWWLGGKD